MSGKNILYLSVEDFFLQPIYSCIHCRANLAHHTDLISKSFQGSQGRAYLFNNVVNVGILVAEERMLLTGLHYVADIYCECCSFILGWKYERAFEPNQRYKEGKYIIELANLIKDNGWDVDYPRMRHSYSKENRKSFSIDWEQSGDSISRSSLTKQCIAKTKNNFIKDLSRDFQYLFGFYDKQNANIENSVPTHIDVIEISEDISNSVMTTSLEGHGASDLRLNSDSDNLESLNNSVNQSGVQLPVDLKLKSGQEALHLSANESADNSSLNTSYSSSKGLLGATCSSDVKCIDVQTRKPAKSSKSKKSSDNCTNTTQYLPSNESLSVIGSGTSCLSNHTIQHRHARHKYKSRHSSNVVNPQKTIVHRRHRSNEQSEEVAHVGNDDSTHGTTDQHNSHSSRDK